MPSKGVSYIAARYLFSRKSHSIINVISILSAIAVAVPTAAMIILLSIYNGLDDVLRSMYGHFDPELKISSADGRLFDASSAFMDSLSDVEGVKVVSGVLDENLFVTYGDRSAVVTARGVDSLYDRLVSIDTMMIRGSYSPQLGDLDRAVIGAGIAYNLGVNIGLRRKMTLYAYDTSNKGLSFLPTSFYRSEEIQPTGVYQLDAETDSRYMIVPRRFIERLTDKAGKVSFVGVKLNTDTDEKTVRKKLGDILGECFKIENRFEQKETIYRIMAYEKIGIFFIVLMVAAISSLTLVASVVMLVADKEEQMFILGSMGATRSYMRNIFFMQGVFISLAGAAVGLILGLAFAFAQQHLGLIKIGGGTLIIDTYPVRVATVDVIVALVAVLSLNTAIAFLTSRKVVKTKR